MAKLRTYHFGISGRVKARVTFTADKENAVNILHTLGLYWADNECWFKTGQGATRFRFDGVADSIKFYHALDKLSEGD